MLVSYGFSKSRSNWKFKVLIFMIWQSGQTFATEICTQDTRVGSECSHDCANTVFPNCIDPPKENRAGPVTSMASESLWFRAWSQMTSVYGPLHPDDMVTDQLQVKLNNRSVKIITLRWITTFYLRGSSTIRSSSIHQETALASGSFCFSVSSRLIGEDYGQIFF